MQVLMVIQDLVVLARLEVGEVMLVVAVTRDLQVVVGI